VAFTKSCIGYSIYKTSFSLSLSDPLTGENWFRKSKTPIRQAQNRPIVSFIDLSPVAKGFSICGMALSAVDSQ